MVAWYCLNCDPEGKHRIFRKKSCPKCKKLLSYRCHLTGLYGLYTHYHRHVKKCSECGDLPPPTKAQDKHTEWLSEGEEKIHKETGVSLTVLDLVVSSTTEALKSVHGRLSQWRSKALLSPENCLLMLLNFLWKNRTVGELEDTFKTTNADRLLRKTASIVHEELKAHVKFPKRIHHRIKSGLLKGTVLFTDTSDTPIDRPKGVKDRSLYYIKKGKKIGWAIKWQVSLGMDGHVWEYSPGYPFSVSDRKVFDESKLPTFLQEHKSFGVGDAHYVRCTNMLGKRTGSKQSIEYKDYNIEIESVRSVIENLNKRVKDFKILHGPWRYSCKDLDFFTHCLGIVCALVNLSVKKHPIRKDLSTLKPRVALAKRAKKKARAKKKKVAEQQTQPAKKHRVV